MGHELSRPRCLVLLAEAAGHVGQVEEGLRLLAEALAAIEASGQGDLLAEGVSAPGRVAAAPDRPGCGSGRSLLPAGPGHCPPPAGQILGAARRHEPRVGCGSSRASRPRLGSCWRRSMAGSPRALTPPTCRRPRRCWRNWRKREEVVLAARVVLLHGPGRVGAGG